MKIITSSSFSKQIGLTLVELLIAMTLGLFVVGAVSTLYARTRTSFNYLEEVARIQETGRFAIEAISRDVRMAGYIGCDRKTTKKGEPPLNIANVVSAAYTVNMKPFLDITTPVRGYGDGVAYPPVLTDAGVIAGTDAIILIGTDPSSELVVKSHDPVNARINTATHSIKQGEILLINDCSKASMFRVSGPGNSANDASYTEHATSGGNCYKFLGAGCDKATSGSYTFKAGSSLLRVYSNAYYIANSEQNNGIRSLWSISLEGNTGGSGTRRELVSGVENMQIYYGLDTDGNRSADKFVTANNVGEENWNSVVSVRISLLVVSTQNTIATGTQSYVFSTASGETSESKKTPDDRVLRRVFSETVTVRNLVM